MRSSSASSRTPPPVEQRRLDANALLVDVPAERHRPRADAADVGVVCPVGRVTDERARRVDRRDDRDVRQVRPAGERIVDDRDVARRRASRAARSTAATDAGIEPEMHRDVRRLREQLAGRRRTRRRKNPAAP